MEIHPRGPGAPAVEEVPVLRLHLAPGVKLCPPQYYDVTQKTLMSQLLPLLAMPRFDAFEYVIAKHGVAPKSRFTVEKVAL